jgi:hypothetical protein
MSSATAIVEIQTYHGARVSITTRRVTDWLVVHRRVRFRGHEHVGFYSDWFVTHRLTGCSSMPLKPERGFRTRRAAEAAARTLERRWPRVFEAADPARRITLKQGADIRAYMDRRIKASWAGHVKSGNSREASCSAATLRDGEAK